MAVGASSTSRVLARISSIVNDLPVSSALHVWSYGVVEWSTALRRERLLVLIAMSFASTSCAQLNPRPGPIRAMEPRPNPPLSRVTTAMPAPGRISDLKDQLRRDRWVARFWAELTPDQRRRVAMRMQHAAPSLMADREGYARYWDIMGLEDRLNLVLGMGSVSLLSTTLTSQSTDVLDASGTANPRPAAGVESRAAASKTTPGAMP
jgi:hypothetical protein